MDLFKEIFPDIRKIAINSILSGSKFANSKLQDLTNVNNPIISNTIVHDINNIKTQIYSNEFLNKKGNIIICNHPSFLDFAILQKAFSDCYCLTDNVDHKIHTTQEYLDKYKIIPYYVEDDNAGEDVKELIKKLIFEGKNVLVFPEGKIEYNNEILPFKKGLFYLAMDNLISVICCSLNIQSGITDKLVQSSMYCIGIPVKQPIINLYLNDIVHSSDYICFDDFYLQCYNSIKNNFETNKIL